MLNTSWVTGGPAKACWILMVPSDLAAGDAAGGQHPIRTAEGEHEARARACVWVVVCVYIIARQAWTSLCVLISGCVVCTQVPVLSVMSLLQPSRTHTSYTVCTHTHTVHTYCIFVLLCVKDVNKTTGRCSNTECSPAQVSAWKESISWGFEWLTESTKNMWRI